MIAKNVALIVPVKDEEATIGPLIDSIARQTALPAEVIFADGGSRDRTKEVIRANIGKRPFEIRLVEANKAGPGEARNLGAGQTSRAWIAFTDAGIILDARWLEELMRPVEEDKNIEVVYGSYEPIIDSFLRECSLMAYIPPKEKVRGMTLRTDSIASSLFKKAVWEKAGPFPPFRAAEDRIFMERVKKLGFKTSYTAGAVARWQIPNSIGKIFKRFCEFSAHDILAGRARDWHYSVFRTYAALALLITAGLIFHPIFLLAAVGLFAARIANIFYRRKGDFKVKYLADPRYLGTIIFIVLVTDAALVCGSMRYLGMRYGKK